MKVYVAGRWHNKAGVQMVQNALRERGHEITHDWTYAEDPLPEWSDITVQAYLAEQAGEDLCGVKAADAIVVLDDPTGRGLFVELGIALHDPTKVIVVVGPERDARSCIFYHLARVQYFTDAMAAVNWVDAGAIAKGRAA